MKGRLLLNIVIRQGPTVLELLASENQALLVGRNAFLVLDLALHIVDRVGRLYLKGNRLSSDYSKGSVRYDLYDLIPSAIKNLRVLTKICMM